MKNAFLNLLYKAANSLKKWTDPAFEGTPYESRTTYVKYPDIKKFFFLRKKMMWRI